MDLKQNSTVFYTCVFGNYDLVRNINIKLSKKFNFFLITNLNIKSKNWNILKVNNNRLNNFFLSRFYKFFLHDKLKKYKYSVYFDGNIVLEKDFLFLLKKFISSKKDIGLFKHSSRSSVYQEISVNLKEKKNNSHNVKKLLNFYRKNKYSSVNDLTENCIIFRMNNSKKISLAMNLWWKLLGLYGKRDQILLPYVIWKTKISKLIFDINLRDTVYVTMFPHYSGSILKRTKVFLYTKSLTLFKILNFFKKIFSK
jgi:hypothetical protein